MAEWQTRRIQNPVPERACGFNSRLRYQPPAGSKCSNYAGLSLFCAPRCSPRRTSVENRRSWWNSGEVSQTPSQAAWPPHAPRRRAPGVPQGPQAAELPAATQGKSARLSCPHGRAPAPSSSSMERARVGRAGAHCRDFIAPSTDCLAGAARPDDEVRLLLRPVDHAPISDVLGLPQECVALRRIRAA